MLSPTHSLNDFGAPDELNILFAETGIPLGIVLPGGSLRLTAPSGDG